VKGVATVPWICQAHHLPPPEAEVKFHPTRKWRFDWAWRYEQVALEIEGGAFIQGRHSRGMGMVKDMEKYNQAVLLGWKVLRCTPKDVATGAVAELLKRALL
jgi:hypothetical protein